MDIKSKLVASYIAAHETVLWGRFVHQRSATYYHYMGSFYVDAQLTAAQLYYYTASSLQERGGAEQWYVYTHMRGDGYI